MKKLRRIILLLLTAACITSVHAQVGELRNDFAFGVNGGVVMDRISFDPTIPQTWKVGTSFGLTGRYTCERYFGMVCAVQMELNYAQMGWKEVASVDFNSNDTYMRTINYFQVPLLAHLRFGKEYNGVSAFLALGPQIGFAISESSKRGGDWATTDFTEEELKHRRPNQITEQYKLGVQNKFDYGITGGLGIELTKPRLGHLCLEGRYYFGLSDIFDNGKSDRFGRSAHGAIYGKVTYLFDIKQLRQYRKNKREAKKARENEVEIFDE